jgi:CBS domain-containing protein
MVTPTTTSTAVLAVIEEASPMRASDVMTVGVVTVSRATTVAAIARIMVHQGIGSVFVVSSSSELLGVVTEADLLRLQQHPDPTRHATPVDVTERQEPRTAEEIMSVDVLAVPADADTADVASTMLNSNLTCVPVVDGGDLIGVISRSDFLRPLCRDDEDIATQLAEALEAISGDWRAAVREGHVRLMGTGSQETATRVAWAIPGVIAVTGDSS